MLLDNIEHNALEILWDVKLQTNNVFKSWVHVYKHPKMYMQITHSIDDFALNSAAEDKEKPKLNYSNEEHLEHILVYHKQEYYDLLKA